MNCNICNKELKSFGSLAQHICKMHNISTQEYYDMYLKVGGDGVCLVCGNPTRYKNISVGYIDFCGCKCATIFNRSQLYEDSIKFESFKQKVISNQKKIWNDRDELTTQQIRDKIRKSQKITLNNMSIEERKEKFGWINKLDHVDRNIQIKRLHEHLKSYHLNVSPEEKAYIIKKRRKTMLGDRYNIDVMEDFLMYRQNIRRISDKTYKKYKHVINPDNLPRGRGRDKYQLDHRYSIVSGFEDGIEVEIMGSIVNLEMLSSYDNGSKWTQCSITKEELYELYQKTI